MADMSNTKGFLLVVAAMVFTFAANAFAQTIAYVPFRLGFDATVKAQQGNVIFTKNMKANRMPDTLYIILGNSAIASPGIASKPVTMHSSRGKISLELPSQLYRSAEISLYSLNGKRVLHQVTSVAKNISLSNIATGVYFLHVKGSGNAYTTRLAHQGGGMNIDVAFGDASFLRKESIGVWDITVSAIGYPNFTYRSDLVVGENPALVGNSPAGIEVEDGLSSSSGEEVSSSSSTAYLSNPPSGVTATANSESSITVNWESVTGATGYYIYHRNENDFTYDLVGSSATTSYTDTGLSSGTGYYYKVAAYNSEWTGTQSFGTYVQTFSLSAPIGLTATANSERSITVSWGSVTGATGYHIYRSESISGTYTHVGTSETTSYTDNSLSAAYTTYYYKVSAYKSVGGSAQSGYVYATTLPGVPYGVTATANSESSITVNWESVTGATGYYIYRSESISGTYTQVGTSETTSYTDNSLSSGTAYYYKVAAYNNDGTGNQSGSGYAYAATLLGVPAGVTATANSANSIIVRWEAVTGATAYYIYRSTTAGGNYECVGEVSYPNSYTNYSLSPGTTYYYKVSAYKNGETSTQSSYASATTLPIAPTDVTATANSERSISISWPSVTGATGYYIYRSESISGTYTQVGTSETTSYTDNSLSSGTAYYYKVAAYNNDGTGNQSGYASAATLLPDVSTCVAGDIVAIGNQIWMSSNLNCDVSGSECRYNNPADCDTHGRRYNWATAMNLPSSCDTINCRVQHPHKGICPSGWHLPSNAEWETLTDFAGGLSIAGKRLKAKNGWYIDDGTDDFGFSALPSITGIDGSWWSSEDISEEDLINYAYRLRISSSSESTSSDHAIFDYGNKSSLYSVRCLQD